jgi:hypothetical protein
MYLISKVLSSAILESGSYARGWGKEAAHPTLKEPAFAYDRFSVAI